MERVAGLSPRLAPEQHNSEKTSWHWRQRVRLDRPGNRTPDLRAASEVFNHCVHCPVSTYVNLLLEVEHQTRQCGDQLSCIHRCKGSQRRYLRCLHVELRSAAEPGSSLPMASLQSCSTILRKNFVVGDRHENLYLFRDESIIDH